MVRLIYSRWLRTKQTPFRVMWLGSPIIFGSLFGAYLRMSDILMGQELLFFYTILGVIAGFSLSLFIPLLYEPDRQAGYFVYDLCSGVSRTWIFLSQFLLLMGMVVVIILVASGVFLLFMVGDRAISLVSSLRYGGLLLVTLLLLIPIFQMLSLKFGLATSVLFGSFNTLLSLLFGTTELGGAMSDFLPTIWHVRLMYTVSDVHSGLFAIYSLVMVIGLLLISMIWYNKWENRTHEGG